MFHNVSGAGVWPASLTGILLAEMEKLSSGFISFIFGGICANARHILQFFGFLTCNVSAFLKDNQRISCVILQIVWGCVRRGFMQQALLHRVLHTDLTKD